MVNVILGIVCWLAIVNLAWSDRIWSVDPCDACNSVGKWYKGGCSGLVAQLLGRSQKWTGNYEQGRAISSESLEKGDIVGWLPPRGKPYGHVAIYVGYGCCDCKYVEAQLISAEGGGWSVCRDHDYGRTLYHMGY